jgi:ABC-2 type transport system permease protein
MNPRRVGALTTRIIRQFRRDRRTLGLLFVVPVLVLSLLGYIYSGEGALPSVAIGGDIETPAARAILDALERDGRLDLSLMQPEEIERALVRRQVDAVLTLPSDLELPPSEHRHVLLHLEGTDPGVSRHILTVLNQVLPAVSVRALAPDGQPLTVDARFLHGGPGFDQLDYLAPVFIGFFAFFFIFLLTSVSFLRERMHGSMERLMVSPVSRPEIVTGYMLGFTVFAAIQSAVIVLFSVYVLRVEHAGNLGYVFLLTLLLTLGAVNLGIFLSTFARTELQVVQFIPVVIVPQGLLSGIIWPVASLPEPLRWIAHALPLTYANEALRGVMIRGDGLSDLALEGGVLLGFAALMVLLASVTLRREAA